MRLDVSVYFTSENESCIVEELDRTKESLLEVVQPLALQGVRLYYS